MLHKISVERESLCSFIAPTTMSLAHKLCSSLSITIWWWSARTQMIIIKRRHDTTTNTYKIIIIIIIIICCWLINLAAKSGHRPICSSSWMKHAKDLLYMQKRPLQSGTRKKCYLLMPKVCVSVGVVMFMLCYVLRNVVVVVYHYSAIN